MQYLLYLLRNAGAAAQAALAQQQAGHDGRPASAAASLAFPIEPHVPAIAEALVHLLCQAPDVVVTRKELMIVTRHLLQTAVRNYLPARLDELMDERVLCGSGRACNEMLRHAACGLLAEIVHNCRRQLKPQQLARATYLFASITCSASLPTATRATCLRAMCVLVDPILQQAKAPATGTDPGLRAQGRRLLGRILESLVAALKHLKSQGTRLIAEARAEREQLEKQRAGMCAPTGAAAALGPDDMLSAVTIPGEREREVVESRALLQGLLPHMKHLSYAISKYHQQVRGLRAGCGRQQAFSGRQQVLLEGGGWRSWSGRQRRVERAVRMMCMGWGPRLGAHAGASGWARTIVGATVAPGVVNQGDASKRARHGTAQHSPRGTDRQPARLSQVPPSAPPVPGQPPPPPALPIGPGGLSEDEIRLMSRLWSYGLRCLKLAGYTGGSTPLTGARESYEMFADVFLQLEVSAGWGGGFGRVARAWMRARDGVNKCRSGTGRGAHMSAGARAHGLCAS